MSTLMRAEDPLETIASLPGGLTTAARAGERNVPFRKESALLGPVGAYLHRRGFSYQLPEVQFFDRRIDLYAYAIGSDQTIAVELKLERWSRAFEQGLIYQLCADFVYLALPINAAARVERSLLERHGVGLIGVHAGPRCVMLIQAGQSSVVMPRYRDFYIGLVQEKRG